MLGKWFVVARCEYKVNTARVRRIRRLLPAVVIILLGLHIFVIAPGIVSLILDEAVSLILSQRALALIEVTFFTVFFYFIVIPFADTLRQAEPRQFDLLLSAPVKPSDLLLGEYLGELPIYAVFITVLGAIFVALLRPLGLGPAKTAVIILIFVLMSLSAFWIGIVGSALLRTKLERYAGGKDAGRAIAMLLPLPMVVIIYAAIGGDLMGFLANPQGRLLRTLLELLPSSWGARVVTELAGQAGGVAALSTSTLLRLGGLVAFLPSCLWLGMKLAERAYNLEGILLSTSWVGSEGFTYRTFRFLGGGGAFGTILVSMVKEYGRRLENISNIAYMLGILAVASIFLPSRGGPPAMFLGSLFIYPVMTVMINADVTLQGRQGLFIYRKVPHGTSRFLRAVILRGLLLSVPLAGGATLVMCLLSSQIGTIATLAITAALTLMVCADVFLVIGLFLINPAFSERSPRFWFNVILVIVIHTLLFMLALLVMAGGGRAPDPTEAFPVLFLLLALITWPMGVGLLLLGKWRLDSLE